MPLDVLVTVASVVSPSPHSIVAMYLALDGTPPSSKVATVPEKDTPSTAKTFTLMYLTVNYAQASVTGTLSEGAMVEVARVSGEGAGTVAGSDTPTDAAGESPQPACIATSNPIEQTTTARCTRLLGIVSWASVHIGDARRGRTELRIERGKYDD